MPNNVVSILSVPSGTRAEDEDYIQSVLSFQQLLMRHGIRKAAFAEGGRERFYRLDPAERFLYLRQLKSYLKLCLDAEAQGIDLIYDTRGMLERTAWSLRLSIPQDFTRELIAEDIVEIFDYDGIQLYRNFRFFEISDYTLDDLFGSPWNLLYERAESLTKLLFERVDQCTSQRKCLPFNIPEHYMRERATSSRKLVKVNLAKVAPLLRDGKPFAWIASSRAEVVVEQSDDEAEKICFLRGSGSFSSH